MTGCPESAVILAAGMGSRLRPLTAFKPKPLMPVHGVPILYNALNALAEAGVRAVTLVIGYRKEAIRYACGSRFAGMEVRYVESSMFERTGSAHSLWLAREALLAGDVLVLEGDVFFEPAVLHRLLGASADDATAVSPFEQSMTGSAVTLSRCGTVEQILINQCYDNNTNARPLFKTINLFRFSHAALHETLVPALDSIMSSGAVTAYVEQVLMGLVERSALSLLAVDCRDLRWFEIDSEADLRAAEMIFAPDLSI